MAKPTSKAKKPTNKAPKAVKAAPSRPRRAAKAAAEPVTVPKPAFSARDRVAHPTFGSGVVLKVERDKLEIKFKTVGVKWIVESFVTRL